MQPCPARLYEGNGPVAYPPRLVGPCRATVCRERAGASRGLCSRGCGARTFCVLFLPWATLLPPRKVMSERSTCWSPFSRCHAGFSFTDLVRATPLGCRADWVRGLDGCRADWMRGLVGCRAEWMRGLDGCRADWMRGLSECRADWMRGLDFFFALSLAGTFGPP
jgi:hypothetical protein